MNLNADKKQLRGKAKSVRQAAFEQHGGAAALILPGCPLSYEIAAGCVRNKESPGPISFVRELSLSGVVAPGIWRPPTFVGTRRDQTFRRPSRHLTLPIGIGAAADANIPMILYWFSSPYSDLAGE